MEVSGGITCGNGANGVCYDAGFFNLTDTYNIAASTIAAGTISAYTGVCAVTVDVESVVRNNAYPAFLWTGIFKLIKSAVLHSQR